MPRHGTWTETGGGGLDPAVVIAIVALVLLFGGGAATAVMAAVTELLIVIAVIAVLLLVAAVVLVIWLARRRSVSDARAAVVRAEQVRAYEEGKRRAALERHQRALELARASAPVIALDPAAIAAAVAGAQQQHPARVIRGEVEQ